jgi:hypothetical protein
LYSNRCCTTAVHRFISLFRFLFDYADNDQSQTLDYEEIRQITSQFPTIFKRNKNISNLLGKNSKGKSFTKDEFLDLFDSGNKKGTLVDLEIKHLDSLIIENNEEYEELSDLCRFGDQRWKLIYQASRDGFRAADFHEKCDGIHNTLTLVKTTDSCVFGGFTGAAWSSTDKFDQDQCSFLFSFKNKMKQPCLIQCNNHEKAIKNEKESGPCFGDGDLFISHASNLNKRSKFSIDESYGSSKNMKNLESINQFQSVEIEVFCKDYPKLFPVIDDLSISFIIIHL